MVPAGSGSPPPMQRQPVPYPGPAGTFKRSTRAPSGTPRSDSSRPRPTPGKRKSRKWGSEAATRGPPPGPDPREGGCGPRQGLPGLRGPRRRRASAETEGAEAAWAWAARPAQERGPRALVFWHRLYRQLFTYNLGPLGVGQRSGPSMHPHFFGAQSPALLGPQGPECQASGGGGSSRSIVESTEPHGIDRGKGMGTVTRTQS